jgi:hypothetical protein
VMGMGQRTYLESFGTIDAPHTDSRHFSVPGKESLELLLKPRNLLTKAFLQCELIHGIVIVGGRLRKRRTAYTLLSNAPFGSCTSVSRRTLVPSPLTSSSVLVRSTVASQLGPRGSKSRIRLNEAMVEIGTQCSSVAE